MDDVAQSYQLFQAFAEMNPQGHIIFASTGGNMYSTEPPYVPRTELDLPLPASIYSIQKLSIEHHLRLICQKHGVKGTVLRISNPYGSILPSCRSQGLIGVTFSKLLSNESLHIIDSPESVRDYLHLDDLISAFNLVIKQHPKQGEFRLFNLSSGRGNSLIEVLNLIEEVTQRKIKKEYSYHHLKPSWSVLSSEKIKMALEWIPKIDLKQGLTKMWDEIQAEHLIAQTHS